MNGCNEDVERGWYTVVAHGNTLHVEVGDGVNGERGMTADIILTPDEAVKMANHLTRMAKVARGGA